MVHFFDVDVAKKYGMDCAVLFQNIGFWVEHNMENGRNYFNGKYWTYNSAKAFETFFPYMSHQKIGRALTKLEDAGLIISGNFNTSPFDRTKWYTLTEVGYAIFKNDNSHLSNLINGDITGDKPIPDINTDTNTNNKQYIESNSNHTNAEVPVRGKDYESAEKYGFTADAELFQAYADFVKMRKSIKKPLSSRAIQMLKNRLDVLAPKDNAMKAAILNQSTFHCWQGVFPLKDANVDYHNDDLPATGSGGRQ